MSLSPLLVLLAWPPIAVGLFRILSPRRGVIASVMVAWLFLPVASFDIPRLPDYDKITATGVGVVAGILLFDRSRLKTLRLSLIELPLLVFCLSAVPAAITNGLGGYEGLSGVAQRVIIWGVPYMIGRLYLTDLVAHRDLALGIVLGGLIYIPLCLFEIVYGPHLHAWVYGFYQSELGHALRLGGWRPTVFMQQGLMVAVWMTAASVVGIWLWWTGVLAQARLMIVGLAALVLTTLLLKSVNGWVLLGLGLIVLVGASRRRSAWPVYALVVVVLVYVVVRANGVWAGEEIVTTTQTLINVERSHSLQFRFINEGYILNKVQQNPLFGMGRRSPDFYTPDPLWTLAFDSLWIIVYGESGWLGLVGLLATLLAPVLVFTRRYPAHTWHNPAVAPAAALAVCLCLYTVDNLLNAMVNPVFMLIAGGLVLPGLKPSYESLTRYPGM